MKNVLTYKLFESRHCKNCNFKAIKQELNENIRDICQELIDMGCEIEIPTQKVSYDIMIHAPKKKYPEWDDIKEYICRVLEYGGNNISKLFILRSDNSTFFPPHSANSACIDFDSPINYEEIENLNLIGYIIGFAFKYSEPT
jgi:hypothetical protein